MGKSVPWNLNLHARGVSQRVVDAKRLSSLFARTADVLERSADLAKEHAQRCAELGRDDDAGAERHAAKLARDRAQRARLNAARWEALGRELDELDRGAAERARSADERERIANERERGHDEVEARLVDDRALGSPSGARERSQEARRQADEALAFARTRVSSLTAERTAQEESAEQ